MPLEAPKARAKSRAVRQGELGSPLGRKDSLKGARGRADFTIQRSLKEAGCQTITLG